MPFNPAVTDHSGQILASGILSGAHNIAGMVNYLGQRSGENAEMDELLSGGGRSGTNIEGPDEGTGEGEVSDEEKKRAKMAKGLDGFLEGGHGVPKERLATMSLEQKRGYARKLEQNAIATERQQKAQEHEARMRQMVLQGKATEQGMTFDKAKHDQAMAEIVNQQGFNRDVAGAMSNAEAMNFMTGAVNAGPGAMTGMTIPKVGVNPGMIMSAAAKNSVLSPKDAMELAERLGSGEAQWDIRDLPGTDSVAVGRGKSFGGIVPKTPKDTTRDLEGVKQVWNGRTWETVKEPPKGAMTGVQRERLIAGYYKQHADLYKQLADPQLVGDDQSTFNKRQNITRQINEISRKIAGLDGGGEEDGDSTPAPAAKSAAGGVKEGATATNPATGQKMVFKGGKWQPL